MNLEDRKLFERAERKCRLVPASDRAIRQRLYRAKYKGEVVSPVRGYYARREWFENLPKEKQLIAKVRALHELNPDWVFCGTTAAVIHGLPVPRSRMDDLGHISPSSKPAKPHVRIARGRSLRTQSAAKTTVAIVGGLPVTSLEETVFECLRTLDFKQGLALSDYAIKLSGLPREEFARRVMSFRSQGKRGAWKAEYPLDYMDARSGSSGESIARAIMIEHLYLLPELQVEVPGLFRKHESYTVDFLWTLPDGTRIAGEYLGSADSAGIEESAGTEGGGTEPGTKKRRSRRNPNGIRLMRFGAEDLLSDKRFCAMLDEYGIPHEGRRGASMALKEAA